MNNVNKYKAATVRTTATTTATATSTATMQHQFTSSSHSVFYVCWWLHFTDFESERVCAGGIGITTCSRQCGPAAQWSKCNDLCNI